MDFDDLEVPSQATSRVSRFAPKSSKLKPKKEPQLVPKIEPQEIDLTAKQNEDCIETISPTQMKSEHNGTVKVEAESKSEPEHDSRNVDSVDVEMTEAEKDSTQVNPMDEDNEEDTVVREIDVFFSPSIDDDIKLYVMEYPLRPSWRPYELDEQCEEVRLKPDSLDVAVDLSVDLESSTVDEEFSNRLKYTKQVFSLYLTLFDYTML
ncbi:putative DNA-directed RNA polymerase III subunit Rpc5 [Medicago truncatula]|uniref:Putative DNA-directed RNA polymerase III subunit Rpc5 n=1 Tax=Medicago truncatula TaxID=3880 RepID=A0A396HPU9_MEDTR|nr:putative DNA-directed RNA polymerase III subunit Rpc5 [Medicago truncatula]